MSNGNRVVVIPFPVSWVAKYRNQAPEGCGQKHHFRSGFLFVAMGGGGMVGWTDEMGVCRFCGMPYRKQVEEEMVR